MVAYLMEYVTKKDGFRPAQLFNTQNGVLLFREETCLEFRVQGEGLLFNSEPHTLNWKPERLNRKPRNSKVHVKLKD